MSKKGRTLALAVASAGLIGLSAPIANAVAADGPGGSSDSGLVNVSHNQIPVQLCNNTIPVNVLGVQVPLQGVAAALGLVSKEDTAVSKQNDSCHQGTAQRNAGHSHVHICGACAHEMGYAVPADPAARAQTMTQNEVPPGLMPDGDWSDSSNDSGLVNVSHNQIPIQVCNNNIPVNVLGVQVPVLDSSGLLGVLSAGDTSAAVQNKPCVQGTGQHN